MKNKTSRTNSMKLKKVIAASLAVFILFAFTGCKTSSGSATTESSKQEDTSTTDSSSSGDLNEKLNDLYQQENQIFADHKDVWDKAFGFMSKNVWISGVSDTLILKSRIWIPSTGLHLLTRQGDAVEHFRRYLTQQMNLQSASS